MKSSYIVFGLALTGLLVVMGCCLAIGRYPVYVSDMLVAFCSTCTHSVEPSHLGLVRTILFDIRLPRILGAVLVGAALGVSGASFQAVFRNPLVSPGMLGVLSGAGFGAALAILLGLNPRWIELMSFMGGIVAVILGVGVARLFDSRSLMMLIFGGLVSSALFTALLSLLKFAADPQGQLPDIIFWLLGSLSRVGFSQLIWVVGPIGLGILVLTLCGRMLDALTMGDDEAATLGVPVLWVRYGTIVLATILAALTVSMVGMIGWVGLIVPHMARFLIGPANRYVLPLSACLGGSFLLICDTLARSVSAQEIPIGIISDVMGVITFLIIVQFTQRNWRGHD